MFKKDKELTRDMTQGSPLKHIISFAVPLTFSSLCYQIYSILDTAIVGRGVSTEALAAVGATGSLWSLIVGFIHGFTNGFGISIAQHFGSKKEENIRKAVIMTMYLCGIIAAVFTALSLIFAKSLLELMETPDNIIENSLLYISIIFWGIPAMIANRMSGGILNAFGNSKVPLLTSVVGSAFNICTDLFLVFVCKLGVMGVALGTILADVVSFPICIYFLSKIPVLKFRKEDFKWDSKIAVELIKLGLPVGCMNTVTAVGMSILQAVVNTMGSLVVAAYVVAHKIIEISYQLTDIVAFAMGTFMGQNIGAGQLKRSRQGVKTAVILDLGISAAAAVLLITLGKPITGLFVGSGEVNVIATTYPYLAICGSMIWSLAMLFVYRMALQSSGNTFIPMFSGLVELIFRLAIVFVLPKTWGFYRICFAEVSAWLFAAIMLYVAYKLRMAQLERKAHARTDNVPMSPVK